MTRHPAIVHWSEIENPQAWQYDFHHEPMGHGAALARHFGLKRIGIHHQLLLPGRRTSFPHAEMTEDEFVYVISGTPDVWLDGVLHRLAPGDGVGFPAGNALAHTFINNSGAEVELLVVGDKSRPDNRIIYPVNPERKPYHGDWWENPPQRPLGGHDGRSDLQRQQDEAAGMAAPASGHVAAKGSGHPAVTHWRDIEAAAPYQYPGHHEPMSLNAAFGEHFGLKRLGIHHERLLAGRRTSFPHAESSEDEFVYVVSGTPDVWLDGVLHRLQPGDSVGFPAGDALAHSFINNTGSDVELMVIGDTSRDENRLVYPINPERRVYHEAAWWTDAPKRPLGDHDGRSDLRRRLDEESGQT